MKFEFILKVKYHGFDYWNQVAKAVVKEEDFDNARRDFAKYEQLGNYFDSLVLINKLDDDGEFIEVVQ